ncbi:MAG: N-acetylmuramoyl-L-alanine amidase [Anaerolineae bacterium]
MKLKYLTLVGIALILTAVTTQPHTTAAPPQPKITDVELTGIQFTEGSGDGYKIVPEGLTMDDTAVLATYISPVLEAPFPYNALVPQWTDTLPDGASIGLMIRTAKTGDAWSEWYPIQRQPDWEEDGSPERVGELIAVPVVDVTHAFYQVLITLSRYQGITPPTLHKLTLTFIDSTDGPTMAEAIAQQQALDTQNANLSAAPALNNPKPTVISRDVWCIYADCNYTGMSYYPVTHLIVHHTVSNNSNTDWLANVRAIWQFHTYTRGWGDIGYNYLVDPNGNLYEGHLGGDDVVGTHASGANSGTMALAFLGDFRTFVPPQPMLDSAVDLFAWKAEQKGINPYEAGNELPYIDWGLPYLMGHRDVYGGSQTTCPGGEAYALLPYLRTQIANRVGITNDYIVVDELSSALTLSNANWHEPPGNCGGSGHAFYTFSTTDPDPNVSTNWGEWRPDIPADGLYEILAYAPYCDTGKPETLGAQYTVYHANGATNVVVNQQDNVGLWTSLGVYYLNAGTNLTLRLSDLTTTDDGRGVWFDDVRFKPLESLPGTAFAPVAPTDGSWLGTPNVTFDWSFNYPAVVANTTFQAATDAAFINVVYSHFFSGSVISHTAVLAQDYTDAYWRVSIEMVGGGTAVSDPVRFSIDTTPPTATVNFIGQLPGGSFVLNWDGSDTATGSGIAAFNVDYKGEGDPDWTPWLVNTTARSAAFVPGDGRTYYFRVQGIDALGNTEAAADVAEADTSQAILLDHAIMLPVIQR